MKLRDTFRQKAADVKFGALASPTGYDWDGDGDFDIISGNTAGYIGFIENLSGPGVASPRFAEAKSLRLSGERLEDRSNTTGPSEVQELTNDQGLMTKDPFLSQFSSLRPIRFLAAPAGRFKARLSTKWGYTTQSVADWDADGLPDIVANSIWGKIVWFRNIGTRTAPKLAGAQPSKCSGRGVRRSLRILGGNRWGTNS